MIGEVQVPGYFRAFITRYFGDHGRSWLAELPDIVARYASQWDLIVLPPFEGLTFNYVAPVRRQDDSPAVLKVGVPEPEQRSEIFALRTFAGRGIANLYAYNVDDHVALIERLQPGTTLTTLFPDRDDEATTIAAQVMRALAIPAPDDHETFASIHTWATNGMHGLRREFDGGSGPFPAHLVNRAESLFRDLLNSTTELSLIHGDLHHDNILSSDDRGGWLAIDPKGLIADRAYEPAPYIMNPREEIHSVANLESLLRRRIDQFSEILEIDRDRIQSWALAYSVLSAWWSFGGSGRWQRTVAIGETLAGI